MRQTYLLLFKSNSVYYAQHIPHKENRVNIIMLMENMGWAYTRIDGISYDDDGSYAITRKRN